MILDGSPYFDEKVKGRVRAEIVLDENQNPGYLKGKSLNHYKVRIYTQTQNPDVGGVTYRLDSSYYDPVRESLNANRDFEIFLTTYGDYPITVDAQVGSETVRTVVLLSDLLKEAHSQSEDAGIQKALQDIETH